MDPVDPKRRGRRLFGGRRRHEHPPEAEMDEPTTTAVSDAPAPGAPSSTSQPAGDVRIEGAGTGSVGVDTVSDDEASDEAPEDDPVIVDPGTDVEISVVTDLEPEAVGPDPT